jgi:dienelactone hydrolase
MRLAPALVLAALAAGLLAGPARADVAGLLATCKSMQVKDVPSASYRFCDDGVPDAGGTTPNVGAQKAIAVPAAYQGIEGLPAKDAAAALGVPGSDPSGDVALDADLTLPTSAPAAGGYPLVVMMHGCCSGSKRSWESGDLATPGAFADPDLAANEKWHYSNVWFAARGYAVLTYTARGFVDGSNHGSTGETQIDSLRYEINDFQQLVAALVDEPSLRIDPARVVPTGGSYGGGFTWLALTDPFWRSPGGRHVKVVAGAAKYGWTDLVYSLIPTGNHFYDAGAPPATDGSDSGYGPNQVAGIPIRSIIAALFISGRTGIPPGSSHATFPQSVSDAFNCTQTFWPPERSPACQPLLGTVVPDFLATRSAYYRNDFFARVAADPAYRIPIFSAGTHTDPLFPPIEHHRMAARLKAAAADYPIQEHYGDYQHFTQNKAKEWGDLCGADRHVCVTGDYPGGDVDADPGNRVRTGVTTRLNRFLDHYARPVADPSAPTPAFDVTASLQVCSNAPAAGEAPDEPGPAFTAPTYDALTPGVLPLSFTGDQGTTSRVAGNAHALHADPVGNTAANGSECALETQPAGPGVASYESDALPSPATMLGGGIVSARYQASSGSGLQLDARLYDVGPDGRAILVDRGPKRLPEGPVSGTARFQLHGNGWAFAKGHRVRLELAQDDDPYLKASDLPSSMTLSAVQLTLPVRETTYGVAGPNGEAAAGANDRVAPTARIRVPRFASSASRSARFPVRWSGADVGSGVARFRVQVRRVGGRRAGRWRTLAGTAATARTSARFRGAYGRTYAFRVRAVDRAGNAGRWRAASTVVPGSERLRGARYRGPWRRVRARGAFGGRLLTCASRSCALRLTWRGRDLAIIGPRSRGGGRPLVTVDGHARRVSFRARRAAQRRVIFSRRLANRRHELRLRVLGGGRVWIDALAIRARR